jgi:tetratricopeptide (TPR) repeat protein
VDGLARRLRQLRRRQARVAGEPPLSYRELAARTGWSHGILGRYFSGASLPPTDRLDTLTRLLGASPTEQGELATIRDSVEDQRRGRTSQESGGSRTPPPPRQLPVDVPAFVGRGVALRELDLLLAGAVHRRALSISVVSGTAGVGKTTLAVHWAHSVADQFPGGQIYINMRGFSPAGRPVLPEEAMRHLLNAAGVSADRIPAGLGARCGLFRTILANRTALLVLDNVAATEQVRPMLPGLPGCVVVVTSRNQLGGLVAVEGATTMTLDLLPPDEARLMLAARLGPTRIAAEPAAVDDIIAACARLPLAMAMVAARAAIHPRFGLADIAAELRSAGDGLAALPAGEPGTDVRDVLSWSYTRLGAPTARLFRLLGLHRGPDITAPAAASLAGLPLGAVRPLLAELTRAHLVAEHAPGRYTFHDLLRAYALELADSEDDGSGRHAAWSRMLDHYLHTVHAAVRLLDPDPYPITPQEPAPGVTPETFDDRGSALGWLATEHPVLLAAISRAPGTPLDTRTWQLAWSVGEFIDRVGDRTENLTAQVADLAAAQRSADRPLQADVQLRLGRTHLRCHRFDLATTHLRAAMALFSELGDRAGQARTHRCLSTLAEVEGRHSAARGHAQRAMDLFWSAGSQAGSARALNGIGWYHAELGDYRRALRFGEQALDLLRRNGDRIGEARTLASLGTAYHQLGQFPRAIDCYRRAVELFGAAGDGYREASVLTRLAETYQAIGDLDAAQQSWQRAVMR